MSSQSNNTIKKLLEASCLKLLDMGMRNKWIHVNRANCINVINERLNEIYYILREEGKRMHSKAQGKDTDINREL
jgi:uncharacterized membrane protein